MRAIRRRRRSTEPREEPSDQQRIREIENELRSCGQRVTREAVARQFLYETGRPLGGTNGERSRGPKAG